MKNSALTMEQRTSRRRKVTAMLAGGLVLGVGAAVTLAAWNDSEFASGSFAAGTFTFQGSTDGGTTWSDHPDAASAAALTFETDADNLSPNTVVYDGYALRVTGNNAEVTPVAPAFGGNFTTGDKLTAEVKVIGPSDTCDAASFAASAEDVTDTPFTVTAGTDVHLCIEVTAAASIEQGDTGTVTWQWDAVSTS